MNKGLHLLIQEYEKASDAFFDGFEIASVYYDARTKMDVVIQADINFKKKACTVKHTFTIDRQVFRREKNDFRNALTHLQFAVMNEITLCKRNIILAGRLRTSKGESWNNMLRYYKVSESLSPYGSITIGYWVFPDKLFYFLIDKADNIYREYVKRMNLGRN